MKRLWPLLVVLVLTGARQQNLPPFETTDTTKVSTIVSPGNVAWRYGATVLDVRDFGADPTGTNDSLSAFTTAISTASSISANIAPGYSIHVPKGTYKFSGTLRIARQVHLFGDGKTATVLRFPAMTTGIVVEYYNTSPTLTGNGSGSVIEGIGLEPLGGTTAWQASHAYVVGDRVVTATNEYDGLVFRCTTAGTSGSSEPNMPAYNATVSDGSVVWTADYAAGVWLKGAATLDGMRIGSVTVDLGFAGHGFQVIASTGDSPPTNANTWRAFGIDVVKARGSGVYTQGADANRGVLISATVGENGAWGVQDASFLGNQYEHVVSQGNELGGFTSTDVNARTTFQDCYSESDEPASRLIYPAMAVGGLYAGTGGAFDGFTADSTGARWVFGMMRGVVTSKTGNSTDGYVMTTLNPGNTNSDQALGFEAQNGAQSIISGTELRLKYMHGAGYTAGTWRWDLSNSDLVVSMLIATSQQASYPQGLVAFPLGLGLGGPNVNGMQNCVLRADSAAPASGTWKACDFVLNTGTSTTLLGWKNTSGGTPGTWTEINVNGAGPSGPTGATGPTGPDWTTCSQLESSISGVQNTGSCGAVVLSNSPVLNTVEAYSATSSTAAVYAESSNTGAGLHGVNVSNGRGVVAEAGTAAALRVMSQSLPANCLAGDVVFSSSALRECTATDTWRALIHAGNTVDALATSTSSNMRTLLSDESGDGADLFQNGNIGTATGTSLTLTGGISGATGIFTNTAAPAVTITGRTNMTAANNVDVLVSTAVGQGDAVVGVSANDSLSYGLSATGTGANGRGVLISTSGGAALVASGGASSFTHNAGGVIPLTVSASGNSSVSLDVIATGSPSTALRLTATNPSSGGTAINATATLDTILATSNTTSPNFGALHGICATNGYVLLLDGDETTPVRALIGVEGVQDTAPSGTAKVGDLYPHTGGVWRTARATTPLWASVSNTGLPATAAAAGDSQATATALTAGSDFYTISGADGTKGITLTQGAGGTCVRVMSQVVGSLLNVYGHNSDNDTVNGGAADAAYQQLGGSSLVYCTTDGTAWFTY